MPLEHAGAVEAARGHLAATGDPVRPLGPLPDGFAATREALHAVAGDLIARKRELETGNEIALRFTPAGFGTIPWDRGIASGESGSARVEGAELVLVTGGEERALPAGDLAAAAELLGVAAPRDERVAVDPDSAAALADWFAFGTVVLADLLDRHPGGSPEPIRLWPEHFDVGTVRGDEGAGRRANFGASPGDERHPEPYLYVGPWSPPGDGELWNGSGFSGAELGYAELRATDDQLGLAASFLDARVAALEARD